MPMFNYDDFALTEWKFTDIDASQYMDELGAETIIDVVFVKKVPDVRGRMHQFVLKGHWNYESPGKGRDGDDGPEWVLVQPSANAIGFYLDEGYTNVEGGEYVSDPAEAQDLIDIDVNEGWVTELREATEEAAEDEGVYLYWEDESYRRPVVDLDKYYGVKHLFGPYPRM